jgi:cell division cycle 2-like
MDYGGARSSL